MCRYLATCVIAAFVYCTLLHNKVPMCFTFKETHSVCGVFGKFTKINFELDIQLNLYNISRGDQST